MTEHDNDVLNNSSSSNTNDAETFAGDEDDVGDKSSSILAQAIASNQKVQICRKGTPARSSSGRMSLMAFFAQEEETPDDTVVTAEPASLQNMRRIARAKQKDPNAKQRPASRPARRGTMRRSHTMNDEASNAALRRKSTFDLSPSAAQSRVRALSPNSRRRHSLVRSKTQTAPPSRQSFLPTPADFFLPHASTHSEVSHDSSVKSSKAYSDHEETIKRLTIQDDEIQKILQDPKAFAKLQKVLRKHGAVTNEVLRQVLPLYVKHQANSEAAKEAERLKHEQEEKTMERQQVVGAIRRHSQQVGLQD